MITFPFLEKEHKDEWLPQLFDLFYANMHTVAPTHLPYAEEKAQWLNNVSPALEKPPRKIVLCFVGGALAGYVQYYVRNDLLMVEELQLKKAYHGTGVLLRLLQYLDSVIPESVKTIEAYAHKRNLRSQTLMHKLGMREIPEPDGSPFVHFQGETQRLRKILP